MIELNYVAYHNNKKCRVLTIPLNNNKILIEYIDTKIRKEVRLDDVEKLQYVEPNDPMILKGHDKLDLVLPVRLREW